MKCKEKTVGELIKRFKDFLILPEDMEIVYVAFDNTYYRTRAFIVEDSHPLEMYEEYGEDGQEKNEVYINTSDELDKYLRDKIQQFNENGQLYPLERLIIKKGLWNIDLVYEYKNLMNIRKLMAIRS